MSLKKIQTAGFDRKCAYLSVSKGIEIGSLKRISEIIREELGNIRLAVLSGPTIVHEIAEGKPATAIIASGNSDLAKSLQDVFMSESFRIYTSSDVSGVELGGSLKNVIAIACGISDGLGLGTNAKAAILSRGLAEISRLGAKMGAEVKTFSGLSGLGDLVTTCTSPYSRNRSVGEQIGKGKSLAAIRKNMRMVAEGVPTAKSAYMLSRKFSVDMPITEQVYAVLYKKKDPLLAVKDLMSRRKRRMNSHKTFTGRGSVWLERLNGVQEVTGSSPVAPINLIRKRRCYGRKNAKRSESKLPFSCNTA